MEEIGAMYSNEWSRALTDTGLKENPNIRIIYHSMIVSYICLILFNYDFTQFLLFEIEFQRMPVLRWDDGCWILCDVLELANRCQ